MEGFRKTDKSCKLTQFSNKTEGLSRYAYGLTPVTLREDELNEVITLLKCEIIFYLSEIKEKRILDEIVPLLSKYSSVSNREKIGHWALEIKKVLIKI
ncbi:hypothetical protein ACA30_13805 [Virgibacillus soli]|nr:hypothetical protein ACA30_13805 [Virgibacillus soli]